MLEAIQRLAHDDAGPVREALARAWDDVPTWGLSDHAARALLGDANASVRTAAARARVSPSLEPELLRLLGDEDSWEVRQAAAQGLGQGQRTKALGPLAIALAEDSDIDVARACANALEGHMREAGGWPAEVDAPRISLVVAAENRVARSGPAAFRSCTRGSPSACAPRWIPRRSRSTARI